MIYYLHSHTSKYLQIGKETAKLEGCNGASFSSRDTLVHMLGGAVYRADSNNRMVNGIDSKTADVLQRLSQNWCDGYLSYGGPNGLITGEISISTAALWSLRTDGQFMSHPNWNDLGFYYLPSPDEDSERYVTGRLRGWGIMKGCNDNPQTGSNAAEAGGLFLREYLDINNYDTDRSFISEEAKTFFFKCCDEYINTDNYNPYYTASYLNEGISGINYGSDVYAIMTKEPNQVQISLKAAKAVVDKGCKNLNDYIEQNIG